MTSSRLKLVIASGLALITTLTALFFLGAPKPTLRLKFLCATNDPLTGASWAVFRLENRTTNYLG
ncbi:MAG TPA: hypothetical protein VHI52_22825, partial [Verrucomicrobiae bacterium]|nr:hypothetical protein [Verrucomicrobiae bacterium]